MSHHHIHIARPDGKPGGIRFRYDVAGRYVTSRRGSYVAVTCMSETLPLWRVWDSGPDRAFNFTGTDAQDRAFLVAAALVQDDYVDMKD